MDPLAKIEYYAALINRISREELSPRHSDGIKESASMLLKEIYTQRRRIYHELTFEEQRKKTTPLPDLSVSNKDLFAYRAFVVDRLTSKEFQVGFYAKGEEKEMQSDAVGVIYRVSEDVNHAHVYWDKADLDKASP